MIYAEDNSGFVIRIQKGEEIVEQLLAFCEKEGLDSGFFYGLGGVDGAEIGFYILDELRYEFTQFEGLFELTNITGNVAQSEEGLMIHAHATIAGRDLNAKAGHLKRAVVAGTVEIYFSKVEANLKRKFDSEVGLKLLDL